MRGNKIKGIVFVVTVLSVVFTSVVSARIIPVAEQAKTNAEPYEHTDVIFENVDGDWELNLPGNSAPSTAATADGMTIPAFDKGKPNENAVPNEHSPAIGEGWVLTVPPNPAGVDSIGPTSLTVNGTTIPAFGKPNDNAKPYDHSPAIGPGWVLTVPPNPAEFDIVELDVSFDFGGVQEDLGPLEMSFESMTVTATPEPSMLILFGLGTFLVRRKR